MKLKNVKPELQEFIKKHTELFPKELIEIILFGSYARNEQRVGSDVDLALVFHNSMIATPKLRAEIREILDNFCDTLELNLFCTDSKAIQTTSDKFDANYWIREEGFSLWAR